TRWLARLVRFVSLSLRRHLPKQSSMSSDRTFRLHHSIYSPNAIAAGAREFAEFGKIVCVPDGDGTLVTLDLREDAPDETADEFLNYILAAALESHLTA